MIKEVTMYTVICDGCGKNWHGGGQTVWETEEQAARKIDQHFWWEKIDGKHYCPFCYETDDDGEYKVKEKI